MPDDTGYAYVFRDKHGNPHVVDSMSQVPADAVRVERMLLGSPAEHDGHTAMELIQPMLQFAAKHHVSPVLAGGLVVAVVLLTISAVRGLTFRLFFAAGIAALVGGAFIHATGKLARLGGQLNTAAMMKDAQQNATIMSRAVHRQEHVLDDIAKDK